MFIQNERGFTLIESLLHCFCFAVVALGLALLLMVSYAVPTTHDVFTETEWEVVSFDINQLLLEDVSNIEWVSDTKLTVHDDHSEEPFLLLIKEPFIYKSKNGGIEPISTNITSNSNWHIKEGHIALQADIQNDRIRERYFYAPNIIQQ